MTKLPNVKIDYGNGALGQAISSADGLLCLVVVGAAPTAKFELGRPYALRKFNDLSDLDIMADKNSLLCKIVKDFYTEAPEGTKVYLVGYGNGVLMADIFIKEDCLQSVVQQTNGEIRGFVVTAKSDGNGDLVGGLEREVETAKLNAQMFGKWAAETRFAPVFTILDGVGYAGDSEALADLKMGEHNRVMIVIGDSELNSANQAVGLVAGRVAKVSVQRNIGRVQDGALNVLQMYAGDKAIEVANVDDIHGKGYVTFRTFTGISGYYIADDMMATKETDDYNQLTRRRTIDKAYRIAYAVLVERLNDEIPVKKDGTMIETYARSFELTVMNAIARNMTANGELSSDPSDATDKGVNCIVNRTINVLSTSMIEAELYVRPLGYGKYIKVTLGFPITQN